MKRDAYDDLYKSKNGTTGWLNTISDECREWVDGLVDDIRQRGREPIWANVLTALEEKYPNDAPKASTTVSAACRKLLNG